MKNRIGIIGLGVMGASLAQNFANHMIPVSVYNHHPEKIRQLLKRSSSPYLSGCETLQNFVKSLEVPRMVLLMIPAGDAVDGMLERLTPLLTKGDIVMDGGNSFYPDTIRRLEEMNKKSIHYVGVGISGGEKGALHGPSMMVGADDTVWKKIKKSLETVAAKDFSGKPCVANLGPRGSGHYVKMVHNGIEYAIMQLITESYTLLKFGCNLENKKIAQIFEKFNTELIKKSYLLEIIPPILRQKTESGQNLIDLIADSAGSKGTGMWAAREAMELAVSAPILTMSLLARYMSSSDMRQKTESFHRTAQQRSKLKLNTFIDQLEQALYAGMLLAYNEGFMLLKKGSITHEFHGDLKEVVRIWQGGCIIRSSLLADKNLMDDGSSIKKVQQSLDALKKTVETGLKAGISLPAFSAALSYLIGLSQTCLGANLTAAMRDFFGAHGYERRDKKGVFHTKWNAS